MLRYSAGSGPSALEPGALEQVEQRHGGLTDIHEGRLNVALQAQGTGAVRFSGLRGLNRTWKASGCLEPFALRAGFRCFTSVKVAIPHVGVLTHKYEHSSLKYIIMKLY